MARIIYARNGGTPMQGMINGGQYHNQNGKSSSRRRSVAPRAINFPARRIDSYRVYQVRVFVADHRWSLWMTFPDLWRQGTNSKTSPKAMLRDVARRETWVGLAMDGNQAIVSGVAADGATVWDHCTSSGIKTGKWLQRIEKHFNRRSDRSLMRRKLKTTSLQRHHFLKIPDKLGEEKQKNELATSLY